VFQAYLTTFLVDPGYENSINIVEEVFTSGINYGFVSIYFDRIFKEKDYYNSMKILENRINCADAATCVFWSVIYRNISSLSVSNFMEYIFYNSKYSNQLKDYQYCVL
jgi:hypothetical protein